MAMRGRFKVSADHNRARSKIMIAASDLPCSAFLRFNVRKSTVNGGDRYTIPVRLLASNPADKTASSGLKFSRAKTYEETCRIPIKG